MASGLCNRTEGGITIPRSILTAVLRVPLGRCAPNRRRIRIALVLLVLNERLEQCQALFEDVKLILCFVSTTSASEWEQDEMDCVYPPFAPVCILYYTFNICALTLKASRRSFFSSAL